MGRKKKYPDETSKKAALALNKRQKRAATANTPKRQKYEK